MRTRRQLITSALQTLRELAAGETPTAEDYELAADTYSDVLAELRDRGLAYWPDSGDDVAEIPPAAFQAVALLLACNLADPFGKPMPTGTDEDGSARPGTVIAMRALRRHIARRPSGEPTPFSSY